MSDHSETPASTYARRVGERLRAIRRQKALSLQEVEAVSDQEFKASVLGAYERGERVISVPRLQRLAHLYLVPVDQLLPPTADLGPVGTGEGTGDEGVVT
ncbi:MAG TPA: helix-turn-helix transcriptional regulator, partial [Acidimicrobiales bacterium]|nr:helix-turn-helix transcriptional regulator [Acidimicrobiales bacterium]